MKAPKILYDLWTTGDGVRNGTGSKSRIHPSKKRNIKRPLPHPGQSYNPDPEDHRKLLERIAKSELEFQKKQASINRAMAVTVSANDLVKHEKEELESGIGHLLKKPSASKGDKKTELREDGESSDTDSVYSGYDEKDFEAILKDKTVEEKRKTKRQRLAQLRDKLQRKAAKLRKAQRIRSTKFDAIKKIVKELDKKERDAATKAKKRHRRTRDQRLGPKLEKSDPIYCLSSELPSSLRETSCSMDAIVREQLESFQSRLMVEPSNFQIKKRKYKKRAFERNADDGQ